MAAAGARCGVKPFPPGGLTPAVAARVPCNGLYMPIKRRSRSRRHSTPQAAVLSAGNTTRPALRRTTCSAASGDPGSSSGSSPPSLQFSLLRIAGDGNCLFRSLAQGAHVAEQEDGATAGSSSLAPQLLPAELETAAAADLRAAICQELLNRREELCFFIDGDYDSYVARMRQPHTWGGEPELAVATHVLHRPITVYMLRHTGLQQISCYGDGQHGSAADLPLLFHGAGHYDLLLRQPPSDAPRSRL